MIIGIRRENKNEWEKRTPLIPEDIKSLIEKYSLRAIVQPSNIRAFKDEEYKAKKVISELFNYYMKNSHQLELDSKTKNEPLGLLRCARCSTGLSVSIAKRY